jgi:sulfur-carrier protein adenylyltransferase/sulfurtransferase
MVIMDFFRRIDSLTPDEVRKFINAHKPEEYILLDVRQPGEYRLGHLPGAKLLSVDELPDRLAELDPRKPTIVYCAAGVRSRAAAAILKRAGFGDVSSMKGGIRAWSGDIAEGYPEAGMTWFAAALDAEEVIALAWLLEDGTRLFFKEIAAGRDGDEAALLFLNLAAAENHHGKALLKLYKELTGKEPGPDFPAGVVHTSPEEKLMEGGMHLAEALSWARERDTGEILELAMSLEISAYDRFIHLRERFHNENVRTIFNLLAAEEKAHLESLTKLFEQHLGRLPG